MFLDSGPLGEITNPRLRPHINQWIQFAKRNGIALRVAEITDYELRRNLMLEGLEKSIGNLNKFKQTKRFVPLTSEALLKACEIWAWLHSNGNATSHIKNIDADVILAAQALSQKKDFDQVIILTENLNHIPRFSAFGIFTWDWKRALHDCKYDTITLYEESSLLI